MDIYFAELDVTGMVLRVVVMPAGSTEQDCTALYGGVWKQTHIDNSKRGHYAGIGYKYDGVKDAFRTPTEQITDAKAV